MKYQLGHKEYSGEMTISELMIDLEKNQELIQVIDKNQLKKDLVKEQSAEEILEELK